MNVKRVSRGLRTPLYVAILSISLTFSGLPVRAAGCERAQIDAALNGAGEKLREMTLATRSVMQAKLLKLKEAKGWSEADYEEKGYSLLEDDRTANLDAAANELLGRLDQLGADDPNNTADCTRISEIEATSLELQVTVRTKSQYILGRLDQLIGDGKSPTSPVTPPASAAVASVATPPPPVAKASPAPAPKPEPRWATETKASPPLPPAPPREMATQLPSMPPAPQMVPPSPAAGGDGFSIDEIVEASQGLFGKVSANLGRVLEHTFSKAGRPTAYILGQETGGAFIAGLRYGSGTLYLPSGGTMQVYWHGPSLGADIGAQGASALFLVYKLQNPSDVLSNFTGIEGSAFVVGGVGATFMSNGRIDMSPIRSGLGLRVGANLGYVRFTNKPTWNPF